jgi:cytochrome b involved in lipid metabolism
MKRKIYLTIFLIVLLGLLGLFFYLNKNKVSAPTPTDISSNSNQNVLSNNSYQPSDNQNSQDSNQLPQEKFFTMQEVSLHNSRESCWSAIRGNVYDLTDFISKHPGGSDKVLKICGKDGTQAFENKHSGQEGPESTLTQFNIGKLK